MKFVAWLIILNKVSSATNIQRNFKSFLLLWTAAKDPQGKTKQIIKKKKHKKNLAGKPLIIPLTPGLEIFLSQNAIMVK